MADKSKYRLLIPSIDNSESSSKDMLSECSNEQEALQRLQGLLSEWLRMENLVVLTGAGCSVESGGKSINDLEESVLKTIQDINELSPESKHIIEKRIENNDNIGFEQWLSYLVNASYLSKENNFPLELHWEQQINEDESVNTEDIDKLINYIAKAIYAECALSLNLDQSNSDSKSVSPHLTFLSKLVSRSSNLGRTHLFTLNYDTLFEQAIEYLGIQYSDGFSGKANSRFDPSVYGLDIYYPGETSEGRVRRFDKFLHFYKLHGSIHWEIKENEVYAQHKTLSKYKDYQNENDSKKKAGMLVKDGFAPNYKDFGILPTSNKFIQTLEMPYAHLFRVFQIRLGVPQTFFVVMGYGFNDEHINRIIDTALTNPSLIMLIVEPNPKSTIIKNICTYKELGKRVFILTSEENPHCTFNGFSQEIMPDAQWLNDFLKLRKFEKAIQKNQSDKENS